MRERPKYRWTQLDLKLSIPFLFNILQLKKDTKSPQNEGK